MKDGPDVQGVKTKAATAEWGAHKRNLNVNVFIRGAR